MTAPHSDNDSQHGQDAAHFVARQARMANRKMLIRSIGQLLSSAAAVSEAPEVNVAKISRRRPRSWTGVSRRIWPSRKCTRAPGEARHVRLVRDQQNGQPAFAVQPLKTWSMISMLVRVSRLPVGSSASRMEG